VALRSAAPQNAELAAALTARLSAVTSESQLEEAWAEYGGITETVRERDLRLLHRFEGVLEHGLGDEGVLNRLPTPISERILDDLDDAWARLRGRELVRALRSDGPSLRAIASEVSVSAPYLSQLAGGAGPVPSRTVLGKLEVGLGKLQLEIPESPVPPRELFESIAQRAQLLRERLRDAERQQSTPQITVDYPRQRIARQLEEQFEAVAARSLDLDGGPSVKELLAALVEEDDSVLDLLTLVLRDELLQKAVRSIAPLEGELKRAALTILGALGPPPPAVSRPRRDLKAPTPRKS
jgi:transcriptional regulator with XRE-family HTH domain